jgi:CubicO group peptidase (beta-lactamase class C family)
MRPIKSAVLAAALFIAFVANAGAQTLPDSLVRKINALFKQWDKPGSPGCAIGIVRNDSLIFAKGYGMANLEYGILNTPKTLFHMASVSKQFTAYAIVLLAKQGKLNLDDDIRKYLPWFPNLGITITIRNLLNHTSGVRDQWQLLATAGTRLDDVITQEQIIKILGKQQALNFKPGEKFMYSNSGFTLLAEIVKTVSGKSLRRFTDSVIFKPLGMMATHIHDDYTEIEPGRSYSYDRKDSTHYSNAILSYSVAGATSLFSNVEDLAKWEMNFYQYKVGSKQDIETLTTKGRLNDGTVNDYAMGISNDLYKGNKRYSHNGADAGYRTNVIIFPDLKIGVIVLSNLGDINVSGKANELADLFVKDKTATAAKAAQKPKTGKAAAEDLPFLKKMPGDYITPEGTILSLELKNDSLFYHVGADAYLLIKDSVRTYCMFYAPEVKFKFSADNSNAFAVTTPGDKLYFSRYAKTVIKDDQALQPYTGTYYSPELDCNYQIVLKDHQLYLTNAKYDDQKLTFAGSNDLLNDNWWMNHLVVTRNSKNAVTGFEVNSGRVMHLKFVKTK